jgi:hypothetical protein
MVNFSGAARGVAGRMFGAMPGASAARGDGLHPRKYGTRSTINCAVPHGGGQGIFRRTGMAHNDSSLRIEALRDQDARRVAERGSRRCNQDSPVELSPEPAAVADRFNDDDERPIGLVIRIISGTCWLPARTTPRDPALAPGFPFSRAHTSRRRAGPRVAPPAVGPNRNSDASLRKARDHRSGAAGNYPPSGGRADAVQFAPLSERQHPVVGIDMRIQ